jgi:hypothetical protein
VIPLAQAALDYYRPMGFASESVEALTQIVRAQRDQGDNQAALKSGQELLASAIKLDKPAAISARRGCSRQRPSRSGTLSRGARSFPKSHRSQPRRECRRVLPSSLRRHGLAAGRLQRGRANAGFACRPPARPGPISPQDGGDHVGNAYQSKTLRGGEAGGGALLGGQIERRSRLFRAPYVRNRNGIRLAGAWRKNGAGRPSRRRGGNRIVAAAAAQLALANAYLAAGDAAQALPAGPSAHDFFAASGQKESEYLSLLSLAKISRALQKSPRRQAIRSKRTGHFIRLCA